MREIPKGTKKGEWFFGSTAGKRIVCLWCPDCNGLGELSATHEIRADDGIVSPSVQCDCGFHEHIRLVGYKTQGDGLPEAQSEDVSTGDERPPGPPDPPPYIPPKQG